MSTSTAASEMIDTRLRARINSSGRSEGVSSMGFPTLTVAVGCGTSVAETSGDGLGLPRSGVAHELMYEGDGHAALADRGGHALDRPEAHVARREDARDACLQEVRIAVEA